MITVLFHMTVKPEREDEFREWARRWAQSTHAEDDGCISFTFFQQQSDARESVLFEQWRDQSAVDAHIRRLQVVYGQPREGRWMPAKLEDLFDHYQGIRYEPIV